MDIINKLNLRSYRTYFQKAWKSKHTRYVNSGQSHRQYRLKLLETEKIRDKKNCYDVSFRFAGNDEFQNLGQGKRRGVQNL